MANKQYVNMQDVIGELSIDYGIPLLEFEDFIELCKRAVQVYNLQPQAKRIPFEGICEYTRLFIQTPFGKKLIKDLSKKVLT